MGRSLPSAACCAAIQTMPPTTTSPAAMMVNANVGLDCLSALPGSGIGVPLRFR